MFGNVVAFLLASESHAQETTILGPREQAASTTGILVPNPYLGDRTIYPGSEKVSVGAQVGDFTINVSGLVSPNASIVLTDGNDNFLRSTVADATGNFIFSQVSMRSGFTQFCLEAVDFRRIGDTEACLQFAPVTASRDFTNIFLPPTIGLFKKQINAGDEALIYGFSMPGAAVDVNARQGEKFSITADTTGYYEYRYKSVPAGKYLLSSTAIYQGLNSLPPKREVELEALSLATQLTTAAEESTTKTATLLLTSIWGFLLLSLLLLIVIAILLLLLKPGIRAAILDRFKSKKHLHHDWYLQFIAQIDVI